MDTHILLWWLSEDSSLPQRTRRLIASSENQVLVSAVSAWEIATKFRLGRLTVPDALIGDFAAVLERERFEALSIKIAHAISAGSLPGPHKDPFDRMLVAQAQLEGLLIVSNDRQLDGYEVVRVW